MNDLIIDALVDIGNHKKVLDFCEPNIIESLPLRAWMVKRVLYTLELFEDEMAIRGKDKPVHILDKYKEKGI